MTQRQEGIESILKLAPVVPVLVIDDVATAVPLARALVAGGLKAIEVTFRTQAALESIRAIAGEVEGAVVGAGTVLTAKQVDDAVKAAEALGVAHTPARAMHCIGSSHTALQTT